MHSELQCGAVRVQCSTVQYSEVQCTAVQYSAVQFSAVQCSALPVSGDCLKQHQHVNTAPAASRTCEQILRSGNLNLLLYCRGTFI